MRPDGRTMISHEMRGEPGFSPFAGDRVISNEWNAHADSA
jgi:hypothetical protein